MKTNRFLIYIVLLSLSFFQTHAQTTYRSTGEEDAAIARTGVDYLLEHF